MQLSSWTGGWHGRERCGFEGFQEAGLRLRTDNSGNRLSPSGSSLVAANLRLAGLRYVSEFPGAKGFPRVLGNKARRPAVCGHRRALQTDQACRTTRRGRSLPAALTRWRTLLLLRPDAMSDLQQSEAKQTLASLASNPARAR